VVIVDMHSIALQMPEKHIRILFELRKTIVKADTYQIMAELIAADLKSIYSVLAVLTDLNDDWRFCWLEEGRIKDARYFETSYTLTQISNVIRSLQNNNSPIQIEQTKQINNTIKSINNLTELNLPIIPNIPTNTRDMAAPFQKTIAQAHKIKNILAHKEKIQ
ncbi:19824_t:CDS:2, partial [Gigaspora margarita]